jgi:hypothetical protein
MMIWTNRATWLCEYTQKGLYYDYVDLVYCNCMSVPAQKQSTDRHVYDSIESYMLSDQHRSSLIAQVRAEDMKVEKGYYGNVVTKK